MCKRMHKMWTKSKKKFTKLKKIRQNSEVVEINDFPQANLRKKIPACKKSTKFLHWNKISFLRSYNTYTCKQENTNFVRFKVTLSEFCWNFVAQQNSNKILFLLEFYGVRGSTVLFRRLYFCGRKSIDPNFPLSTKFCKILLFLRSVFFVFVHVPVNKILWNFVADMSENKFCSILFASGGTQEHEGRNQWFQQRPRSTNQGQHAGARGAEPVVPTEAPHQGRRRGLPGLVNIFFTKASGTDEIA